MTKYNGLVNKIKADAVQAIKDKETAKLSTLRLLVAELEKEKVSHKLTEVTGLSDEQTLAVINRQIKKLDKEIESYVAVGRGTNSQEIEKEILVNYLPEQASEEEIRELVAYAVGLVEKGEIRNPMQYLSQHLKGKADMGLVMKIVKEFQY
ncbi:MAG: GatB/YqeY domain-containing protein [Psychrobacillus sp.]